MVAFLIQSWLKSTIKQRIQTLDVNHELYNLKNCLETSINWLKQLKATVFKQLCKLFLYQLQIWMNCIKLPTSNLIGLFFLPATNLVRELSLKSHLNNVQQSPVHDEPDEDVDEKDWDGVPTEQEEDGPRGQAAQQHALGKRLQEDGVRTHRRSQFCPSEK